FIQKWCLVHRSFLKPGVDSLFNHHRHGFDKSLERLAGWNIEVADRLLYRAKANGRNRVEGRLIADPMIMQIIGQPAQG
ncbi:hypothetical protein, partial [Pseudomonas syringae]